MTVHGESESFDLGMVIVGRIIFRLLTGFNRFSFVTKRCRLVFDQHFHAVYPRSFALGAFAFYPLPHSRLPLASSKNVTLSGQHRSRPPSEETLRQSIRAGSLREIDVQRNSYAIWCSPTPLLMFSMVNTLRGLSTSVQVNSSTTSTATSLSTQLTSCLCSIQRGGRSVHSGTKSHGMRWTQHARMSVSVG